MLNYNCRHFVLVPKMTELEVDETPESASLSRRTDRNVFPPIAIS